MALPHRVLLSLLETLGTIVTLFKSRHWAFACWKAVGSQVGVWGVLRQAVCACT